MWAWANHRGRILHTLQGHPGSLLGSRTCCGLCNIDYRSSHNKDTIVVWGSERFVELEYSGYTTCANCSVTAVHREFENGLIPENWVIRNGRYIEILDRGLVPEHVLKQHETLIQTLTRKATQGDKQAAKDLIVEMTKYQS
jgi:hypothetical protein